MKNLFIGIDFAAKKFDVAVIYAEGLQRVAQRFSDVCTLWSSYQWANISAEPHVAFYVNDQAKTKVFLG